MATNQDKIKQELEDLVAKSVELYDKFGNGASAAKGSFFINNYEGWYTEARRVVEQLLPERLQDFVSLYKLPGARKQVTSDNYRIVDFLHGVVPPDIFDQFNTVGITKKLFSNQAQILVSANKKIVSSLMDIREVLVADLFDTEIDRARALHKNKLLREAGVIAGVVLEAHLQNVATAHAVKIAKKNPTISDLNDPLKNGGIYDVPTWRLIQRLGDIRNMCDHSKDRSPTSEEVVDLIDGADKISKTVF